MSLQRAFITCSLRHSATYLTKDYGMGCCGLVLRVVYIAQSHIKHSLEQNKTVKADKTVNITLRWVIGAAARGLMLGALSSQSSHSHHVCI